MKSRLWMALVMSGLCCVGSFMVTAADSARVTDDDGVTARMVADMVSTRHINHPAIDDDISQRLLDRYVDVWDPQKLYFMQSDIDVFRALKVQLDDKIREGDVRFASTVFERFQLRMQERATLIGKLIDLDHSYTVDEEMVVDPDDLDWAKTESELAERWRKRIKFDLLLLKLEDTELAEGQI